MVMVMALALALAGMTEERAIVRLGSSITYPWSIYRFLYVLPLAL